VKSRANSNTFEVVEGPVYSENYSTYDLNVSGYQINEPKVVTLLSLNLFQRSRTSHKMHRERSMKSENDHEVSPYDGSRRKVYSIISQESRAADYATHEPGRRNESLL